MRCDECATENVETSEFCKECGAPLKMAGEAQEPVVEQDEGPAPESEEIVTPHGRSVRMRTFRRKAPVTEVTGSQAAASAGVPVIEAPEPETSETQAPVIKAPAFEHPEPNPPVIKAPASEPVAESAEPEVVPPGAEVPFAARFIDAVWQRKGPILMSIFIIIMMGVVWAPWAFIKLDVLGLSLVSRDFNGWEIYVGRIMFFLSIVPLIISVLLVANVGTRRRVVETHVCTFLGGVIFTIWLLVFVLSEVLKSLIGKVQIVQVNVAGGQVATIFLFVGFMLGIIITSYDRGRLLRKEGG